MLNHEDDHISHSTMKMILLIIVGLSKANISLSSHHTATVRQRLDPQWWRRPYARQGSRVRDDKEKFSTLAH